MVLFFSVRGEGKYEKNYKKRKKNFSSFRGVFGPFLVASFPEKLLGSVSGVRRRSREEKNVVLRKRCSAHFLGIMCRKNGVYVGRCMCPRNHGGIKVICKKLNLSVLSGILGHFKS